MTEVPDPYHTLPGTIQDYYAPPLGEAVADSRPQVVRITQPNDRRLEIHTCQSVDVWVWDSSNPGRGRWLQIERKTT